MLTKELLRFQQKAGVIRPLYAKRSRDLRQLAEALVDLAQRGVGEPRGELEATVEALSQGVRPVKVAKGLVKLWFDRLEFEEPDPAVEEARWALFYRAQAAREALTEAADFADYEAALTGPEGPVGRGEPPAPEGAVGRGEPSALEGAGPSPTPPTPEGAVEQGDPSPLEGAGPSTTPPTAEGAVGQGAPPPPEGSGPSTTPPAPDASSGPEGAGQGELAMPDASGGLPLAALRAQLHADLPKRRKLAGCKLTSAEALLDRYDLATAQSLLLYSSQLILQFGGLERPVVRRVLGWLRFCRLVAELRALPGGEVELRVDGPAAIFEGSKRYGLQLASFLSAVPLLERWQLRAEVQLPRRPKAELQLSDADPLKTHLPRSGYIPEEISRTLSKLKLPGWEVQLSPPPIPVGTSRIAAPDLALLRGERRLVIELFHPWHRGALGTRLEDLRRRPQPELRLGVDAKLYKDAALAAQLDAHPQVFRFNGFPSARVLSKLAAEPELPLGDPAAGAAPTPP